MSPIPWLEDNNFSFPDAGSALTEPDGLLAASEHLTPELVINAYQQGVFPWYSDGQPVLWWSPNPRCVLYPQDFHVSRSFKRTLNSAPFEIKTNTSFRDVMLACAKPRIDKDDISESGTWITDAMLDVYCKLHDRGITHSIECWQKEDLVGGMYGLVLGDIFFGESMFSQKKDASKAAMHYLCTEIRPYLVDAQVYSDHLQTLGAVQIERHDFVEIISSRLNFSLNI